MHLIPPDQPNRPVRTRTQGGVGGALSDGRPYPDVCRARHVFLRVSRAYHESGKIGKSQTQPGSGEGCSGCARGHFALARDAPRGSRPAEAGYRERMGRRTEIELGGSGGTNPQHRTKSPNCHRPGTYTRRSCAERRVFTPGDFPCCPGPSRARGIDWGFE